MFSANLSPGIKCRGKKKISIDSWNQSLKIYLYFVCVHGLINPFPFVKKNQLLHTSDCWAEGIIQQGEGKMWGFGGRYYWRRKENGGKREGIVVVFAWMSSTERHLNRYVQLYSSMGWNSLVCHSQFLNM